LIRAAPFPIDGLGSQLSRFDEKTRCSVRAMPSVLRVAWVAGSASLLPFALVGSVQAAGFYLQEQSVAGLGRAYSGEAAEIGADSLWWNPAAVAQVQGVEVYGGLNAVLSQSSVSDRGSTIQRPGQPAAPVGGGSSVYNPLEDGVAPNLDAAWRVSKHLALGLAVSAPFDFTTKYDPNSFARYQALTARLLDLDVQPTLALHVSRHLDLGAGFDAQYAQSTLSSSLPNLSARLPDGNDRLQGDGWNYGWTAGVQLRPSARLTLGGSYRSRIDHELNGSVKVAGLLGPIAAQNGTLPASAKFSTPWIAVLGARYALDDHWSVHAQAQEVGWSAFNAIRVTTAAGRTVIPQGYHDTTTGAVGVDYQVNPKWTLRSGVAFDPTPTPNTGRSARVPDGDRWLFTLGTTVRPTPRLELIAAAAYVDLHRSRIDSDANAYAGTPIATPISYDAEATGSAVILSSGVKFRF
jgi:long-chain fatty acid transport protein